MPLCELFTPVPVLKGKNGLRSAFTSVATLLTGVVGLGLGLRGTCVGHDALLVEFDEVFLRV